MMSIIYGCIMGLLSFVNCYADSRAQRTALLLVVAAVSLIFGVMGAKGYILW